MTSPVRSARRPRSRPMRGFVPGARRWAVGGCCGAAGASGRAAMLRRCGCATMRLLISDGPFAESKEQMGGYDVIECADLDEAIEVASKHPVAEFGVIEVRPLWEA